MHRNFPVVLHFLAEIVDVSGTQIDEDIEDIQDPGKDINSQISWIQDGLVDSNSDRHDTDRIYGNSNDDVVPQHAPFILARDDPPEFSFL